MKPSLAAFADEMAKIAFSTDMRRKGMGGVKRPPFPTVQSTKPIMKNVDKLNAPKGGSSAPVPAL